MKRKFHIFKFTINIRITFLLISSVLKQNLYLLLANCRVAVPVTSFQLNELIEPVVPVKYCRQSLGAERLKNYEN